MVILLTLDHQLMPCELLSKGRFKPNCYPFFMFRFMPMSLGICMLCFLNKCLWQVSGLQELNSSILEFISCSCPCCQGDIPASYLLNLIAALQCVLCSCLLHLCIKTGQMKDSLDHSGQHCCFSFVIGLVKVTPSLVPERIIFMPFWPHLSHLDFTSPLFRLWMKQALACVTAILLESVMLFIQSHFGVSSETAS